jgi:hypothetical protein
MTPTMRVTGKKYPVQCSIVLEILLIISFASYSLPSGPIEGNINFSGLPLLLLTNPSLLAKQNGIPIGVQVSYDPVNRSMITRAGIVAPIGKNGVSFAYVHQADFLKNRIYAGFGHVAKQGALGGSFTVAIDSVHAYMGVNVAGSLFLPREQAISLVINSIVGSDTVLEKIPPQFNVYVNGPFPFFHIGKNLVYDFSFGVAMPQYKADTTIMNGSIWLRSAWFERYPLFVSAGYSIEDIIRNVNPNQYIGAEIGTKVKFGLVSMGLYCGYRYAFTNTNNTIVAGIYFNPVENRDIDPPRASMKVVSDTITGGCYFILKCDDGPRGSGIRQWTIIIASTPSTNSEIIKTYSGGNIPPTSIFWDLRDSHGQVYESREAYVMFMVLDMADNVTKTDWIPLYKHNSK